MIRHILAALAVTVLPSHAAPSHRNDPSLPTWNADERKEIDESDWVPGALLLNEDPPEPNPLDSEKPTPEELVEASAPPSTEIPEKFLAAYFGSRPETYLVDPHGLLVRGSTRDRLAFLTAHAADSEIDLFVYIFGKDQEIPGEVREEEVIERFFSSGRPTMIVYYFMQQPQQTMLYLSPSLTDAVSAAEQRRALTSSVMQALAKADSSEQLEAFTVQMGIRIYWMENMIHGEPPPEESGFQRAVTHAARKAKSNPSLAEKLDGTLPLLRPYLAPAAAGSATLAALVAGLWWWRRRASYQLPAFDVDPRLGGQHAAGVGGVISFANYSLSPAAQRQQVPDYLHRP